MTGSFYVPVHIARVRILVAPPLTSWVGLYKLPDISAPLFPHLKWGDNKGLCHRAVMRAKFANKCTALKCSLVHSEPPRDASRPSTHLGNVSEHLLGPLAGPGAGPIEMNGKGPSLQGVPHPVGAQTQEETFPSSGLAADSGQCLKQFNLLDSQVTRLRHVGPPSPRSHGT